MSTSISFKLKTKPNKPPNNYILSLTITQAAPGQTSIHSAQCCPLGPSSTACWLCIVDFSWISCFNHIRFIRMCCKMMQLVDLNHSICLTGFPLPILRLLLHHLLNTLRQQSLKSGSPIQTEMSYGLLGAGWGCISVADHLLKMWKALGLIPSNISKHMHTCRCEQMCITHLQCDNTSL